MNSAFRVEVLASNQDRSGFRCGEPILDKYFETQVSQDIRRFVTKCFVALDNESDLVAGFYTLASSSVSTTDLPEALVRRLPRYANLPAARTGRLAVDQRFSGRGLGAALLGDAVARTVQSGPAAWCLVVDAKNETAAAFYVHHGFQPLASEPRTLFLPLATGQKLLLR
ncbi:MAG: GNAT family N-acetyltransferase [Bryobacteraceae bacterium]|nr:GNAT family N-acetyltransferase [Bryobacteraceae bacterium]